MQIKQSQKRKLLILVNLLKSQIIMLKLVKQNSKIPSISCLVTTSALTAVANKIPSISNLIKKTNYDIKISELEKELTDHNHDKYITTKEFNKLTAEKFAARLTQANLITKTDYVAKLSSLNRKITSNKKKTFTHRK